MDVTQATPIIEQKLYELLIPEFESEPAVCPQICDVLPWDDRFMYGELIQSLTDVGEPDVVGFGHELPDRSFGEGWTVYAKTRKVGHKISFPIELLRAADASQRVGDLIEDNFVGAGRRFVQQQEKFCAGLIEAGALTAGSSTYFDNVFPGDGASGPTLYIYDGLPFFDTAHALKHSSSTPSNHTAAAVLGQTTLEAALTLMERTSAVDERGEPIVNRMDTMLVPAGALEFTARVLLGSAQRVGSGNNDMNSVQGRLNLIPWRFLSGDADAWYLWRTTPGQRPIRMRDSMIPTVQVIEDLVHGLVVVQAFKYFSCVVRDWRGAGAFNIAAA